MTPPGPSEPPHRPPPPRGYQAPEACVEAVLPHLPALIESAPEGGLRIFDVGCGNGLSGVPFRALDTPIASLDGLDLSPVRV